MLLQKQRYRIVDQVPAFLIEVYRLHLLSWFLIFKHCVIFDIGISPSLHVNKLIEIRLPKVCNAERIQETSFLQATDHFCAEGFELGFR